MNDYLDGYSSIFANMTLYAASGELIISMERFRGMLKSVQCSEHMVLAFNSDTSFQYAIHAWKWVNEADRNSFIIIADDPACAPRDQRRPFNISGIHYDEQKFTA